MDVKSIVTFLEVADTRSFSVSANNLNVTQPAVSKRVALLEEQLSTRLFDRVGKGVILTEAGRLLVPSARKISAEINQIEAHINRLADTVGGTLSLGVTPYVASGFLPECLDKYCSEFSDVNIAVEVQQSPQLLEDLENGFFEIGLCELEKAHTNDIDLRHAQREQLCIVAETSHALTELSDITTDVLTTYPAVLPPPGSVSRVMLSNALAETGFKEHNPITVPDFYTLRSLVQNGIGWGILPRSMCESDETLSVLDVEGVELDLQIYFIHRQGRTLSQAAAAFAEAIPVLP